MMGRLTVDLWHPDSPGVRLLGVRPCWARRLGLVRGPFATTGEALRHYRRGRHEAGRR